MSAAFVHDLPLVVRPTTPHSLADTGLSFDLSTVSLAS